MRRMSRLDLMTLVTGRRSSRFALCIGTALLLSPCGLVPPLQGQQSRLTPAVIGEIVDAVLSELVPPDTLVSRVPVGKRGVYFDHERSMKAFGYPMDAPISLSDLHLRNVVRQGSRRLLEDCRGAGMKPCHQLGWGVYAAVEPISISDSGAVVRAIIRWADRGPAQFEPGVAPTGPSILVGFVSEVELIRMSNGHWKFAKLGRTRVSD